MKVRSAIKQICLTCKVLKRKKTLRVICSNRKHKQRQK